MLTQQTVASILLSKADKVFIAYSGGVDSHVLLHLVCSVEQLKSKTTAVYINHGLQKEAEQWALHCEAVSLDLGIKFQCINVNVQKATGQSLEEIAREARYAAFKALLESHGILLLAQHREDQMETVLLQLFRGAGVKGLSGMPLSAVFGRGKMLRPFLDISKNEIICYAEKNKLQWIEDPSNKSDTFDRNFLRNQIIPQLKDRWPALDKTIARSARHCAKSEHISQSLAEQLLNRVFNERDQTLDISQLMDLDINQQQLVIRQWFQVMKLRMPSEKKLERILSEVVQAKASANPEIHEQGHYIKRYRNRLYCLNQVIIGQVIENKVWLDEARRIDLNNGFSLTREDSLEGIPKTLWHKSEISIKFREGSEKIKLPGRNGHHSLKNLFQEKAIPPWERSQIPLVYLNNQLAAISDLWISADFYSADKVECYQLNYSGNEL
ncbi:MAG: tRNA lysidine(34) synthetase TilS [Methylococcaceae bacterium]|nr:tRNA lysidine(34) synthetase TilS [Methylococcaceae bacterium]